MPRLGLHAEASVSHRDALDLAPTDVERRHLLRRLAEGDGSTPTERSVPKQTLRSSARHPFRGSGGLAGEP
jgi:hypothetical protein